MYNRIHPLYNRIYSSGALVLRCSGAPVLRCSRCGLGGPACIHSHAARAYTQASSITQQYTNRITSLSYIYTGTIHHSAIHKSHHTKYMHTHAAHAHTAHTCSTCTPRHHPSLSTVHKAKSIHSTAKSHHNFHMYI